MPADSFHVWMGSSGPLVALGVLWVVTSALRVLLPLFVTLVTVYEETLIGTNMKQDQLYSI